MAHHSDNISASTQVVLLVEVRGTNNSLVHPRGAVGVVTRTPADHDRLLAVKRGELPWPEVNAWRKELHCDFERAQAEIKLPESPDCESANPFLVKARREMVHRGES